jgi:spoIIIJ-associated protein
VDDKKKPETDGALILDDVAEDGQRAPHPDDDDFDDEHGLGAGEDGKAEASLELLGEIVTRMGLDVDINIREDGEEVVLDIQGEDIGRVIGKKGQTLDALQFIINKIINRFPEGRRHIVIDSGDYRERREQGLASMARREAKRAVQHGRIVTLEPMTPRDRRVVHLSLAKFPGISTRSDGEGNERRVRIIPARRRERGGSERGGNERGSEERGSDERGGDDRETVEQNERD